MTPAEIADGLALLERINDAHVDEAERGVARDVLQQLRGLLRDLRTGPDDVALGRAVPVFKPSLALMKLQTSQPPGALDEFVRWVDQQARTKGRRRQDFAMVTDDGTWTQVWKVFAHRPPLPMVARGLCRDCAAKMIPSPDVPGPDLTPAAP